MVGRPERKGAPHLDFLPAGPAAICWWSLARTIRAKRRQLARKAGRAPRRNRQRRRRMRSCTRRRSAARLADCASPARAPRRLRPGAAGMGRLGRFRRGAGKVGRLICATFASCWTNIDTARRSTAISGTAAFTCASAFDLQSEGGIRKYAEFVDRAADLVVSYGGSLSGEHGDGQSRGALLPKMFGSRVDEGVRRIQSAPGIRTNRHESAQSGGSRICPPKICAWARITSRSSPPRISNFPTMTARLRKPRCAASGSANAASSDTGSMCPSYMVTLEEQHSTRGRAHMLFELLQGEVRRRRLEGRAGQAGARSVSFVQGLQIGMPGERGHRDLQGGISLALLREQARPLYAYAFGMLDRWAATWVRACPGWRISDARAGPAATCAKAPWTWRRSDKFRACWTNFRRWARGKTMRSGVAREENGCSGQQVDAVGGHVQQLLSSGDQSAAQLTVLQRAGFRVSLMPGQPCAAGVRSTISACLTRPRNICSASLRALRRKSMPGMPVVVLEPSCASVFRDELRNLLPEGSARHAPAQPDVSSQRISRAARARLPAAADSATVLLHGHCHQKALMKMSTRNRCCARWARTCNRSIPAAAEWPARLVSKARNTPSRKRSASACCCRPCARLPGTLIVSDGFSCREQIIQATGRAPAPRRSHPLRRGIALDTLRVKHSRRDTENQGIDALWPLLFLQQLN